MKPSLAVESNASLLRAYESFDAMDAWGVLRTSSTPLTPAQLADRLGIALTAVQTALDLLEAAALVKKLRAGGGRRAITYASAKEAIDVELPGGPDTDATIARWTEAGLRHQEAILARMLPYRDRLPGGDRYWAFAAQFKATKSDFEELLRRMVAVTTFFRELVERTDKPAPEGEQLSRPHAVFLRVAPLRGAIREGPVVKIQTDSVAQSIRSGRAAAPASLARREREIALLLQRGLSRAQVSKRLGISVETVSSHCKNLFRKLGIKRATELSRFSLETKPVSASPGRASASQEGA
ncbi:MAG: Bacterial regulatory protein luxR family [Planctomycetota bacterium]|jgi:DNA-binding CsgD family transcriptional regulator